VATAAAPAALLLEGSGQRAIDAVVETALAVEAGKAVIDVRDESNIGMHRDHLADDGGAAAAAAEHERKALIHDGRGYRSSQRNDLGLVWGQTPVRGQTFSRSRAFWRRTIVCSPPWTAGQAAGVRAWPVPWWST